MPLRRPVSPLSLETCQPSPSDSDIDGLIGSDDELDGVACAERRRRIEKLAESYLQGTPLFILSASLRGPFEEGWVNPWRKNRKNSDSKHREKIEVSESLVIQETDPRKRRHTHDPKQEIKHQRLSSVVSETNPTSSVPSGTSGAGSKSRKRHKPRREKASSRGSASSHGTPKRSLPWLKGSEPSSQLRNTTISRDDDDSWLKKDRKRIGFQDSDPPTSPTTHVSTRHSDIRGRQIKSSSLKQQPPAPSLDKPRLPGTSRSESIVDDYSPNAPKPSPLKVQQIPCSEPTEPAAETLNPHASLCVVSSSSQLPKFEYRRRKVLSPREKEPPKSPSAKVRSKPPPSSLEASEAIDRTDANGQSASKRSLSKQAVQAVSSDQKGNEQLIQRPATSTRDANVVLNNRSVSFLDKDQLTSYTTGENTGDRLPSAQQVPGYPSIGENFPSLHSTAVPNHDSEYEADTSPEAHFSTQAAVLLAQESFQHELESPEQERLMASGRKRRASQTSPSSPNSKTITPFHRVNSAPEAIKTRHTETEGLPMNTQCLVDAVTPFTFSTEKKTNPHFASPSKHNSSSKRRKKASFLTPSFLLPADRSPSLESENGAENANFAEEESLHGSPHQNTNPKGHQSDTQATGLPLTLNGSTLTDAQDGQGGHAGPDSFNLSQAIADAGSWLQQSFDLNRDIQNCSSKEPAPPSSAGARQSALGLDTTT